tara:strand:+ start:2581 stop:3033 length:453 start_codon:yes stop_codon:yes gene_type:complete
MSLLTSIFAGGAGEVIEKVGGVVDNLHTSKEEKLQLKNELEKILHDANKTAQEAVSSRWQADMNSDSWLSKNIRPLTLVFLTIIFVIMSFFDGNIGDFVINDAYKPIYQTLLITVYGAYFAGRSIEKVTKSKNPEPVEESKKGWFGKRKK